MPIDVDLLFGEPTVALRGPWGNDLVQIAPTAKDLGRGLWGYHLDFPGNALQPGCDYLHWQQHLGAERTPRPTRTSSTDPAHPGKLALQYWFFYVFNDWNNLHEGDWEMIQIVFDASTVEEALHQSPVEVGYSQHEGAERAAWDDPKLERVAARTRSCIRPTARTRTSTARRCISAAPPRRASAATTRGADRRRAAGGGDHPE